MLIIRDSTQSDLSALTRIRNTPDQFATYHDLADGESIRFLVGVLEQQLVAFAMLYLRQPTTGSPESHIPKISDLYVAPPFRSRGIGSTFITHMETLAFEFGHKVIHISVDPVGNRRAITLYRRLGYIPLQNQLHQKVVTLHDDDGTPFEQAMYVLPLIKNLP
jgi:GNAT superfamily N-acetyltransferase